MKRLDLKYKWKFFAQGAVAISFLLSVIFGVCIISELSASFLIFIFAGLEILLIALMWLWAKWHHYFYRWELYADEFRREHGVVWKKYTSIPFSRIQHINIRRGVWDRLLGLSSLDIHTAGANVPYYPEGLLPGLSIETAKQLRTDLIRLANEKNPSSGGV